MTVSNFPVNYKQLRDQSIKLVNDILADSGKSFMPTFLIHTSDGTVELFKMDESAPIQGFIEFMKLIALVYEVDYSMFISVARVMGINDEKGIIESFDEPVVNFSYRSFSGESKQEVFQVKENKLSEEYSTSLDPLQTFQSYDTNIFSLLEECAGQAIPDKIKVIVKNLVSQRDTKSIVEIMSEIIDNVSIPN